MHANHAHLQGQLLFTCCSLFFKKENPEQEMPYPAYLVGH